MGFHNQFLRAFLPLSAITSVIWSRYISQYPAGVCKESGTIALTISSHSESSFLQFCGYANQYFPKILNSYCFCCGINYFAAENKTATSLHWLSSPIFAMTCVPLLTMPEIKSACSMICQNGIDTCPCFPRNCKHGSGFLSFAFLKGKRSFKVWQILVAM